MANNPAFGTLSPRQAHIVRGNNQSVDSVDVNRSRSRFDLSYSNYMSARFGEVRPFFHARCIAGDNIKLRSVHELWSEQLKSPLMSDLTMYKDFFYVPFKALMPNTWDLFKNTPVQGDDVPEDVYLNCPIGLLFSTIFKISDSARLSNILESGEPLDLCLRCFALLYHSLSSNSLLNQLGISTIGNDYEVSYYDVNFERVIASAFEKCKSFTIGFENPTYTSIDGEFYSIVSGGKFNADIFRRFINEYVSLRFPKISGLIYEELETGDTFSNAARLVHNVTSECFKLGNTGDIFSRKWCIVDLAELYAYGLICSQFYVNDNVDTIFTAIDFMQEQKSFMIDVIGSEYSTTFDYNGSVYYYDTLSLFLVHKMIWTIYTYTENNIDYNKCASFLNFWANFLFPAESLRFLDYFTGSRLNLLAVGSDTEAIAPVVGDKVSAIDVTKSIAWQSFLNDVNKLGPVAWIQQSGIFGNVPSSLDPMPREISRESCPIGSMQIENNSSENQGNIVSRMRSESGQYMFDVDITEDSLIIGLMSFDIPRIYSGKTSRFAFTYDRNDFFSPYFQNIGDQEVFTAENWLNKNGTYLYDPKLHTVDFESDVYGWQIRDTQYKQRFNVASGAFVSDQFLPSWAFICDERYIDRLNAFYIRNHNSDFDKYYVSLPNLSNAGYYHFYVRFRNICSGIRKMQKRPGIQLPKFHQ